MALFLKSSEKKKILYINSKGNKSGEILDKEFRYGFISKNRSNAEKAKKEAPENSRALYFSEYLRLSNINIQEFRTFLKIKFQFDHYEFK